MRLLNAKSIALEAFPDDREIPPYAVLSHTWGDEEVTFQEMTHGDMDTLKAKQGFTKIRGCCQKALGDGLHYVWVDTCCIDKSSSAELSEAINSMFRWYKNAKVCYAHLNDAPAASSRPTESYEDLHAAYASCRWFTRGWTLQELLAPADVQFVDASWNYIGTKLTNLKALEEITRIGRRFLRDVDELQFASVAQRMSWAAGRKTTRREDAAYCLLGIFGINMPLLYGEGDKAFFRLQEEIMKESDDQSLFAWNLGIPLDQCGNAGGLLAPSPSAFANCGDIIFWGQLSTMQPTHYYMTNKGLRIELPLVRANDDSETVYAVLDCLCNMKFICLPLSQSYHEDVYQRTEGSIPRTVSARVRNRARRKVIYLQKHLPGNSLTMYFGISTLVTTSLRDNNYRLIDAFPPHAILKVDPTSITCGDAHRIVLLFRRDRRHLFALLITAAYTAEKHHLSRPVLQHMTCQVAAGLTPRRFLALILEGGLARIASVSQFKNADAVGSHIVSTAILDKTSGGWTMGVHVDTNTNIPDSLDDNKGDSDTDDMEPISMVALAAMFNNTNRDFRLRQAWARRNRSSTGALSPRFAYMIFAAVSAAVLFIWKFKELRSCLAEQLSTLLFTVAILVPAILILARYLGKPDSRNV
ncbi:HET-domain-containing protein [Thozetella sp. PMI_491]|nr:HET-domain-containing protein [Thozetella sp. PMI_491]